MPMIAMTVGSSMSVKPARPAGGAFHGGLNCGPPTGFGA